MTSDHFCHEVQHLSPVIGPKLGLTRGITLTFVLFMQVTNFYLSVLVDLIMI